MTGLSYSALIKQANNKPNQFMNYMELSCNEKFNDANKMERQAKQIKSQQVDLVLLPDSAFETPNRLCLMTPALMTALMTALTTKDTTNSTIESVLDSDSD
jgi:tryptophan synthase alpha subunit